MADMGLESVDLRIWLGIDCVVALALVVIKQPAPLQFARGMAPVLLLQGLGAFICWLFMWLIPPCWSYWQFEWMLEARLVPIQRRDVGDSDHARFFIFEAPGPPVLSLAVSVVAFFAMSTAAFVLWGRLVPGLIAPLW
jgi:hypothetical protein